MIFLKILASFLGSCLTLPSLGVIENILLVSTLIPLG